MLDFRFDGEELFLIVDKTAMEEGLSEKLEEKISNVSSFIAENNELSVFFEGGMDQADLVPFFMAFFKRKNISLKSINFLKPPPKKIDNPEIYKKMPVTLFKDNGRLPKKNLFKVLQGSIRSGQIVYHNGDLLVLGNINKGARVGASGNLIVIGSIRGYASAGKADKVESFILAQTVDSGVLEIGEAKISDYTSKKIVLCVFSNGRIITNEIDLNPFSINTPQEGKDDRIGNENF